MRIVSLLVRVLRLSTRIVELTQHVTRAAITKEVFVAIKCVGQPDQ